MDETLTWEVDASSPTIPPELWKIYDPPKRLWLRGKRSALALLERLPRDGLAVVGTRRPQARSRAALRAWILDLTGSELIVLSGFARGIDTIAHEAALQAGLPTIAVMATGLDRLYPPEHVAFADELIAAGGLLVSEAAFGEPARPHRFLQRNRIIAAWARATWVVEAPARSGALNTAMWAREHDRICFAVPSFPGDPALEGNQRLLDRDHAVPFWGIHSLGLVWLKLATHQPPSRSRAPRALPRGDVDVVVALARSLCFEAGGATFPALLGAAIDRGWEPGRFFLALKQAVSEGALRDEAGVFTVITPLASGGDAGLVPPRRKIDI